MKPFLLLAATGLSALVTLPHLPDMATMQKEVDVLLASVPTHLPTLPQPAQPDQASQFPPAAQAQAQGGITASASSSADEPLVAQASPDDVRHSYGEPQRVERTSYGETWYYPVYIVYIRNGFVHRVPRAGMCMTGTNVQSAPAVLPSSTLATQAWRFSNHSSLGTTTLNGAGVQRTSTYVPRQTVGVPATVATTTTHSSFRSGGTYSAGVGSSTGTCYRPPTTSTATVSRPAVQRSVPTTTASVYAR